VHLLVNYEHIQRYIYQILPLQWYVLSVELHIDRDMDLPDSSTSVALCILVDGKQDLSTPFSPSSTLKLEAAGSSEMFVSTYMSRSIKQ
jgi:hypothetical protein